MYLDSLRRTYRYWCLHPSLKKQPWCISYLYRIVQNTFKESTKLHFSLKGKKVPTLFYSWLQVNIFPSCWSLVAWIWFTTKKHKACLFWKGLKQIFTNNSAATSHLWRWLILHAEQLILIKHKIFTSLDLIKDQGITSFTTIIHSMDFYVAGLTLSYSHSPLKCCNTHKKKLKQPWYAVFTFNFTFIIKTFWPENKSQRFAQLLKKVIINLIYRCG